MFCSIRKLTNAYYDHQSTENSLQLIEDYFKSNGNLAPCQVEPGPGAG